MIVPIRHLASTVPAHTWTFRPGRTWTPHGRYGLLAAHPGYRTVFLVTAALILPAEFRTR